MTQQTQEFRLPNGEIKLWTLNEFLDWLIFQPKMTISKSTGYPVQLDYTDD